MIRAALGALIVAAQLTDVGVLTVPAAKLPQDCALERTPRIVTDASQKANIRELIEGSPKVPDGPPLGFGSRAYAAKWAEDVAEAYSARYVAPGEAPITVYAVRFTKPQAAPFDNNRRRQHAARVDAGLISAVISSANRGPCFAAVREHLQSLAKR